MRSFFITMLLVFGTISGLNAMSLEDQELVTVSIYKRACEVGLVSKEAANFVRNMERWRKMPRMVSNSQKSTILPKENYVRIDLIHLFTKAVIGCWKKSFGDQHIKNNQYIDFLLENKMPLYDITALYQVLDKSVQKGIDPTDSLLYVREIGGQQMFEEIISENLKLLGLTNGFYKISKKRFDRIIGMGENLVHEKNVTIKEYQRARIFDPIRKDPTKLVVKEDWIVNLYLEAVKDNIVSEERGSELFRSDKKVAINPVNILTSALFQFVAFDSSVYDFLIKYGIRDVSIFRMTPLVRSFFCSDTKIVRPFGDGKRVAEIVFPTLNGMQYILHTITNDLAEIGIYNSIYYISKDSLNAKR